MTATVDVQSGLEGVVASATEITESDKDGGALRYRGVDIEEFVGRVPFEQVWACWWTGTSSRACRRRSASALRAHARSPRGRAVGAGHARPQCGFRRLIDVSDEVARDNLARDLVMAMSFVAQSARGSGRPRVPRSEVDTATSIPERLLIRWRGEADPRHVKAIDAYWITAAEHGRNASTFTAWVVASTGADVAAALSAAVGALFGPLHGGAPARVLEMLDDVERAGDAERYVKRVLDRGERLGGFGTASTAPSTPAPGSCAAPPTRPRRRERRAPRRWSMPRALPDGRPTSSSKNAKTDSSAQPPNTSAAPNAN